MKKIMSAKISLSRLSLFNELKEKRNKIRDELEEEKK